MASRIRCHRSRGKLGRYSGARSRRCYWTGGGDLYFRTVEELWMLLLMCTVYNKLLGELPRQVTISQLIVRYSRSGQVVPLVPSLGYGGVHSLQVQATKKDV